MSLIGIYNELLNYFGEQHWWPTTSTQPEFEIIVGAILTQQTTWKNVERSIQNLKQKNLLTPEGIFVLENSKLERLIRPCGFYKLKARRLKNFVEFLFEKYDGSLKVMFKEPLEKLRQELLSVNGIGYETCDSILLYAGEKPIFVVDAYTFRLCKRYEIINSRNYEEVRKFFENNLPKNVKLFKEFHALIVALGKNYCKTKPLCKECPLVKCKFKSKMRC